MKSVQTLLLVAAAIGVLGGLSAASAMPMAAVGAERGDVQQVRLVCDQFGRCYRTGPRYRYNDYRPRRTWNGCRYGFTVQDGVCKPYRGY
jgi:hypothetical protein